jgi:hypothetical protein
VICVLLLQSFIEAGNASNDYSMMKPTCLVQSPHYLRHPLVPAEQQQETMWLLHCLSEAVPVNYTCSASGRP